MVQLSLVLACYNEEQIFEDSMREITDLLELLRISYEIILVEDCSTDKTRDLIQKWSKKNPKTRTIFHQHNQGRGKTITDGFLAADGEIVGFIDMDLEIPAIAIVSLYLAALKSDGATAHRVYKLSLGSLHRHLLSRGYSFISRKLLNIPYQDTETGGKFFRRKKILPVLKKVSDPRWFWDTEIMTRSFLAGLSVAEIPVLFIRKPFKRSTVRIFSDTREYFSKLFAFRGQLKKEGLL